MSALPPDGCLLCALGLPPLSEADEETLRRARVFLFGAIQPTRQAAMLLAGYTPEVHINGVYLTSILSGERPFWEWREWRALRPPRDPDLPHLVTSLVAFAQKWVARAVAAAQSIADEDDRAEVRSMFEQDRAYPSQTWWAKAFVQRIRGLRDVPLAHYQAAWNALLSQGLEAELVGFDHTLSTVQDFIRTAPLDALELDDMQCARQEAAPLLRTWLKERRAQLAHLDEDDLTTLALGSAAPLPGFDPAIQLLARFNISAKA